MEYACSHLRSSSLHIPWPPSCGFSHTLTSSKLKLSPNRLKSLNLIKHHLVVRNACGFDENGSVNGFSITPNKLFMQEAIGAEYGEGFETFRSDGPFKVDVDFLNDKLQEGFLPRIRYAMKPDEAYGLNFSFDNVVSEDMILHSGKEIPEDRHIQRLMLHAGAGHVLRKLLIWDEMDSELDRVMIRFSQLYYENLINLEKPMDGLKERLDAVSSARIPCAIVSSLDRRNMLQALERLGLHKCFQAIVMKEDGMKSTAHRFFSAAVKIENSMWCLRMIQKA